MSRPPSVVNVAIDPDRLLDDLRRPCGFGVVRPSLSPIDAESRRCRAGVVMRREDPSA